MLTFLLLSLLRTVLASSRVLAAGDSTVAAAWYTGWHAVDFPLSQVSWSKYTHLIYAFAWVFYFCFAHTQLIHVNPFRITTPDVTTLGLGNADLSLLPQFVSSAHQHVKSLKSVVPPISCLNSFRMLYPCYPLQAILVLDGFLPMSGHLGIGQGLSRQ